MRWSTGFRNSIGRDCLAGRFHPLEFFRSQTRSHPWLARLRQKGIGSRAPYTVLQPGARLASMRWPATKFAEVARWLRRERGIASVVNLASGDTEVAAEVRHQMRECAVILEALNVRELIALIAGAQLFVGKRFGPRASGGGHRLPRGGDLRLDKSGAMAPLANGISRDSHRRRL